MRSKNIKKIIVLVIALVILILLGIMGYKFLKNDSDTCGSRCDALSEHVIKDKTLKKVKDKFKEIEEVKSAQVYTKNLTVKIMVELENDVELDRIKETATEILTYFTEDELSYYDFALYVTSKNKDSEIYPVNVSKHSKRDNFAW